jgi:hypothetical protein
MGISANEEVPTVYVSGPQEDIRLSEGCILGCLSALRRPAGWPSQIHIVQSVVVGAVRLLAMFFEMVPPAETAMDSSATWSSVS